MPDLPENWSDYYSSFLSCEKGNNCDSTLHSQIWSPNAPHFEKIQYLLSNEKNAILFAADADKKIITLHSFKKIDNGLVCLVGGGRDVPVIRVVEESLTAPCNGATPDMDVLLSCTTAEDVDTADAAPANHNYQGSATFLGVPWLALAVMKARTHHPRKLIPIAIDAAKSFLKKHNVNSTIRTRVKDSVRDFVQWAWLVAEGNITNIEVCSRFSIDADICSKNYRSERESACLQKETMIWNANDTNKLDALFIDTTVDPSNFSGIYIVWVLREYFPRRFERCHNKRQREGILKRYREKACKFLADMSIDDGGKDNDRIAAGKA